MALHFVANSLYTTCYCYQNQIGVDCSFKSLLHIVLSHFIVTAGPGTAQCSVDSIRSIICVDYDLFLFKIKCSCFIGFYLNYYHV